MKITDLYGIDLYCMVWYSWCYMCETKYDFLNVIKSQFLCLVYGSGFHIHIVFGNRLATSFVSKGN